MNFLLEEQQSENPWRENSASMAGLSDKVEAVLEDQVTRHQVIKLTEAEAVERLPGLVIASLGSEPQGQSQRGGHGACPSRRD